MKSVVIISLSAVVLGTILGLVIFRVPEASFVEQRRGAAVSAVNVGTVQEINLTTNELILEQFTAGMREPILLHIEDETTIVQKISSKNHEGVTVSWTEESIRKELIMPGDRALVSWFNDERNKRFVATHIQILREVSVE